MRSATSISLLLQVSSAVGHSTCFGVSLAIHVMAFGLHDQTAKQPTMCCDSSFDLQTASTALFGSKSSHACKCRQTQCGVPAAVITRPVFAM